MNTTAQRSNRPSGLNSKKSMGSKRPHCQRVGFSRQAWLLDLIKLSTLGLSARFAVRFPVFVAPLLIFCDCSGVIKASFNTFSKPCRCNFSHIASFRGKAFVIIPLYVFRKLLSSWPYCLCDHASYFFRLSVIESVVIVRDHCGRDIAFRLRLSFSFSFQPLLCHDLLNTQCRRFSSLCFRELNLFHFIITHI